MTELKIMNYKQTMFYVDNGVQPIRVEHGYKDKLVFVFSKEDTYELYGEWIKKCREFNNNKNKSL